MTRLLIFFILATGLSSQTACLQNSDKAKSCYSDKLLTKEKVFAKTLHKPHFKGGHDSLVSFLSANIDIEKFIIDLSQTSRIFSDTARINFIVNKYGGLSDLSVKMTKRKKFADEVTRVIKKSSCNWVAGGTERPANGWHQIDIYFSMDKPSDKEVRTIITINEL